MYVILMLATFFQAGADFLEREAEKSQKNETPTKPKIIRQGTMAATAKVVDKLLYVV